MKKQTLVIILLAVFALSCLALAGCSHAHEFGDWNITRQPTCTEDGIAVGFCACGEQSTKAVPKLGHNYNSVITEPTCTRQGYTTHTCSVCNDISVDTYVDALGHDEIPHEAQNATCTKDGWEAYVKCSRCGYNTYKQIPATGHSVVDWTIVQKATCTEEGQEQGVCECGETITRSIAAKGHNYVDRVCSVCGDFLYSLDLNYKLSEDGLSYIVVLGSCKETDIFIPPTYNGKPVTSIGRGAFSRCESLETITIPNSVTSIGEEAFYGCRNLSSITIPSSIVEIGGWTFAYSGLTRVTIPTSVTNVDGYAFYECSSIETVFYAGTKSQWDQISFGTHNQYLTNKTLICNFNGEDFDEDLNYNGLQYKLSDDGTYYIVSGIGTCTDTDVVIPSEYYELPVKGIGNNAFSGCESLENITIASSVTSLGSSAFSGCINLKSITIPSGVTSIDASAFNKCKSLDIITVPKSVVSIGDYAFLNCTGLKTVIFEQQSQLTSIGSGAFYDCTSLTTINLEQASQLTSIDYHTFYNCIGIANIVIPSNVTSIGTGAFRGCTSLDNVVISSSVTSIGEDAFRGCTSLDDITIPLNMTSIGGDAFCDCTNLKSVIFEDPNGWYFSAIAGSPNGISLNLTNATQNVKHINTYGAFEWYKMD